MKYLLKSLLALLFNNFLFSQVMVVIPDDIPGLEIGIAELKKALVNEGYDPVMLYEPGVSNYRIRIQIETENKDIRKEGFIIKRIDQQINITASDRIGAIYGMFDLAEEITAKKDLDKITFKLSNPAHAVRGIKFNLPWDAYRESKSMDYHLSVCRDLKFWEAFLNMMLENRFNLLALYNMHPFPYLVKLQKYPEACPFTDEEMKEWKKFWKRLFRMAKERGIEVFIVNWNIIVPKSFAKKYQVDELNDTSSIIVDYTRESVRQVIDEYEDLTGLGVTLADWMNRMTPAEREDWIAATFIEGINQAGRKVKFLHRAVLSGSSTEMRRIIDAANLPDPALVEVKFNWSHGHSTPDLVITHANDSGIVNTGFWSPEPENYKIQWMIRNEDFFILRWGEPDFIRDHIETNSHSYVNGYYIGSEGYIPAFEYFTRNEIGKTWQYAFERQWLFYMLWGRLLYDPKTSNRVFEEAFNEKYNRSIGKPMLRAYRLVSRMPLRLASFFAGTWDYTLYAEGFLAPVIPNGYGMNDGKSPFISIDELIDHKVLDSRYISIADYVAAELNRRPIPDSIKSPPDLANDLLMDADTAMHIVSSLRNYSMGFESEFDQELDDIQTWALLSKYFANKLRAGVALQKFRKSGEPRYQEEALKFLEICLSHWKEISRITSKNYYEVPYFAGDMYGLYAGHDPKVGYFSWEKYIEEVQRDIEIVNEVTR